MSINEGTLRLRADGLSWTPTEDGEVVLLDHATARYVSANSSAAELWALLAQGSTQPDLEDALVAKYGVPPEMAREDVGTFIADLRERGLLVEQA